MRRKQFQSIDEDLTEEPLINLTPLIDVVFVVLIAFMLIAPVLDIDIVQLAQGGKGNKMEAANSPLAITLKSDNTIWFHGKRVNLPELEQSLKIEKKRNPLQIPQLIPDKQAHFGEYQSIKNVLESCGFDQMDIVLQPQ